MKIFFSFLEKESKAEHRSISEIIRESIKEKFQYKTNILLDRLDSIFGIWKNKNIDTVQYLRNIRKDREL